jgi:hypothetical protein
MPGFLAEILTVSITANPFLSLTRFPPDATTLAAVPFSAMALGLTVTSAELLAQGLP